MKQLVIRICIATLRKLKVSTVIGCEIESDIKQLYREGRTYDNVLHGDLIFSDGTRFEVPNGKFSYKKEAKQ